jgi:RimJ/RimL family protein N-acetyltransferase
MRLQGSRLYLRPLELGDAEGNYPEWLNDPEVCRWNSHGEILYTKAMALEYIESVRNAASAKVFAICMKDGDRHVGNISLQSISERNCSAEFAILIGEKEVYGQGVGYEAAGLLFTYGFEALHLHRIYCGTPVPNIGMKKLAKKLGMHEEGQRKEAFCKGDTFYDVVEYGYLNKADERL